MTKEEAIYRLKNTAWLGTDKDREETEQAVDMAIEALSAKAVELIMCKDCKHFVDEGLYCEHFIYVMFDHFYCYYGERKEE